MSQYTPIIGSGNSGLEYRNQVNDGKQALLNHHKGSLAPSYAEAGCIWLDDSTTPWVLKIHDGAGWIKFVEVDTEANAVNTINHATDITGKTATAIAVADNILFSDTSDSGKLKRSTVQGILDLASGAPTGSILDYAGTVAPSGYLNCNGAAVSRTVYANLFAAIGTVWGVGDGSSTFNLPNLSRRTTIGSGGTSTSTISNIVGSTGGAETHTLITSEMPAHTHTVPTNTSNFSASSGRAITGASSAGVDPITSSMGGGEAHNNMQPSAVVMKIIKI